MKPGPKIGSLQKRRKCRRLDDAAQSRHLSFQSNSCNPNLRSDNNDLDVLNDESETEGLVPTDYAERVHGTKTDEDDQTQNSHLNMHDLSYILHPSHESRIPNSDQNQSACFDGGEQGGLRREACAELGVSQSAMNQMIRAFFENMVAINIFHEPSFAEKLSKIPSLCQLNALLAAIAGYASRFTGPRTNISSLDEHRTAGKSQQQPEYFVGRAFNYVNKALVACDDEMPPLCILQALIIATHCQLTRGVRGKAWRSLGLCVRLAYEMNLHQLDSRTVANSDDIHQWQADEEKRRAFWAVWEMDVFASTVRQTPTAIDWGHMEILLPVDNANWFSDRPSSSCFMDADPNQSWKALQDTGNQSPKAWFLVINSFMKVAHSISDPQRLSAMDNPGHYQPGRPAPGLAEERCRKLEKLGNAVRCFNMALPGHLRYRDQYLAFGAPVQGQLESQRQQHCSLYNIFIMTQLVWLMIHRHDAFRPQTRQPETNHCYRPGDVAGGGIFSPHDTECTAQRQYYEAADRILRIVSQSCEDHIQHISPFLSSTLWLASAVQLVRKHFTREPANRSLVKSRFDVLYMTYRRSVEFWDTQTAMQRNLESLEEQLEARKRKMDSRERQASSAHQTSHIERLTKRKRTHKTVSHTTEQDNALHLPTTRSAKNNPPEYIPETPIPVETSALPDGDNQSYVRPHPAAVDSMAMVDMMLPPQSDRGLSSGMCMMPTGADYFDPTVLNLGDARNDPILEWRDFDLSGGIQDLLAEWTTY
ncbi:unnamed protein product [Penicillium nalgiovense]|uniref:Xylanolytic transcriptional activator regulatory domain-containing protein n=2 Tax=Penicillium nalgiovense TaxID=60175 RepID=A0A9W4MYH4_PENNA|nr:unnamed protein product [Penicillium nalgiovense]CAG7948874.1 unnamed protein product [Penicillium nalgiovense]CAG7950186.1 unnamed protein product [Penicillium nalgiovense]CAG7962439.1 unnamed protein product [Penicillium nalgiovense]CAG7987845.1 unnamed protein product [Penicillium nalgiovense]